ncbi:fuconate dehydratase, partial [Streptomyces gramineus]
CDDPATLFRDLIGDSQLRWLGPEKGVMHMAIGAVTNAVWDLAARRAGKPLWQLLADAEPEWIVRQIDFRYLTDALTPEEALGILRRARPGAD